LERNLADIGVGATNNEGGDFLGGCTARKNTKQQHDGQQICALSKNLIKPYNKQTVLVMKKYLNYVDASTNRVFITVVFALNVSMAAIPPRLASG